MGLRWKEWVVLAGCLDCISFVLFRVGIVLLKNDFIKGGGAEKSTGGPKGPALATFKFDFTCRAGVGSAGEDDVKSAPLSCDLGWSLGRPSTSLNILQLESVSQPLDVP